MTSRCGIRRATYSHPRRTARVRRASARPSPSRAAAALVMLASAGAIYGLAASPTFGLQSVVVGPVRYTDSTEVTAVLDVPSGTNLFSLSTDQLVTRLRALPGVVNAEVTVRLPDTLAISVRERDAILVWSVGNRKFLVDRDGLLFATATAGSAEPSHLPTMADTRAASAALTVGGRLDAVDLDAATRLGALRPADIGSAAASLAFVVSDENGFTVKAAPRGWTAIFGFYTPSLRRPDIIPGQVRLLATLLAGREPTIDRVILASDTSGTYIPRPSATPSPTPRP